MRRWSLALALLAGTACRGPARSSGAAPEQTPRPSPTNDPPGGSCEDVGGVRACWGEGGAPGLFPRPVPLGPAGSTLGWRCVGSGADRVCLDRRWAAPPFRCAGDRCVQLYPRLPDDGEWQCADSGSATVCKGGERAAGVAPAPPERGWRCGRRVETRDEVGKGERICVDLSPDFPDGTMTGWRCRYENEPPLRRICARDPGRPSLTAPCDPQHPCLDGSVCVSGVCLPSAPHPDCWLDEDCAGGRCRFGSCAEAG